MVILTIRKPGLFIHIPGLQPSRTPVKVDISSIDINIVKQYLQQCGIKDYDISFKTAKPIKIKAQKPKKIKKSNIDLSQVYSRFDKLEEILAGLVDRPIHVGVVDSPNTKLVSKPKVEDLDVSEFIPNVDIGGLKITGTSTTKTTKGAGDISDSVALLKGLSKKK